jgi:hypothetical protein
MRRRIALVVAVFLFGSGAAQAFNDASLKDEASAVLTGADEFSLDKSRVIEPLAPHSATIFKPFPTVLAPLYLSFSILQALDIHSTLQTLDRGAGREANPVMQSAVNTPSLLLALKVASSSSIVLISERLRKHHPKMAVLMMAGLTSLSAAVVAHNYGVSGRGRSFERLPSSSVPHNDDVFGLAQDSLCCPSRTPGDAPRR